jgi:hypothetical protein
MAYNMDHRYETYAAAPKGKVNQTYPTSARKGNVDHTYPTYFAARKAPADGYHFLNTYEPAKKKPLRYPRTLWEKLSLPFKVNYYAPYYTVSTQMISLRLPLADTDAIRELLGYFCWSFSRIHLWSPLVGRSIQLNVSARRW